jgi:phospholipase/carboxylesterase
MGGVMKDVIVKGSRVRLAGGEDRNGGGDGPLVVLLHGFGAPGDDLVPLFRQLDVPRHVRFAFPEALLDLGELLGPGYAGGRAWWMIDPSWFLPENQGKHEERARAVPEGLVEARTRVGEVLSGLGAKPENTILGGFSQGAMLSLDYALRAEQSFAGLALLSGSIVAIDEWQPLFTKLSGVRVMQSHGRADPILPFAAAQRLRDLLKTAGADVHWVEFNGGHTIPMSALDVLGMLVRETFGE